LSSGSRTLIPQSEITASTNWVDPFIGFRARADLSDQRDAALRADIGGFGIGSELTWNAFAALGYQVKENTTLELGYRHTGASTTNPAASLSMRP